MRILQFSAAEARCRMMLILAVLCPTICNHGAAAAQAAKPTLEVDSDCKPDDAAMRKCPKGRVGISCHGITPIITGVKFSFFIDGSALGDEQDGANVKQITYGTDEETAGNYTCKQRNSTLTLSEASDAIVLQNDACFDKPCATESSAIKKCRADPKDVCKCGAKEAFSPSGNKCVPDNACKTKACVDIANSCSFSGGTCKCANPALKFSPKGKCVANNDCTNKACVDYDIDPCTVSGSTCTCQDNAQVLSPKGNCVANDNCKDKACVDAEQAFRCKVKSAGGDCTCENDAQKINPTCKVCEVPASTTDGGHTGGNTVTSDHAVQTTTNTGAGGHLSSGLIVICIVAVLINAKSG